MWLARAQSAAGFLLILIGALANPWLLEKHVLLDHTLTSPLPVLAAEGLLLGAGAWLLVVARRTRREARPIPAKAIAFACVAAAGVAALTLAAGEIAVRATLDPARALRGDAWWERRWRLAHGAGLEGESNRATYSFDQYDPDLGWRPRPSYRSDSIRTNALGIRADREYPRERDPLVPRIVLVGDSYTWGEGVPNEESFPAVLESLLPGVEALNLGVHGYGTDQQLLYLRRFGFSLAPDLVILGFFDDDMSRNVLTFRDYAKPRFVIEEGRLVETNVPVPPADSLRATRQRLPRSLLAALAREACERVLDRTVFRLPSRSEAWLVTRALLEAARWETEATGARFLLVTMPIGPTAAPHAAERLVTAWAESTGTEVANLREAFLRLPRDEQGRLYGPTHWTALGNRRAAEAIRDEIRARGLVREPLLPSPSPSLPPAPPHRESASSRSRARR